MPAWISYIQAMAIHLAHLAAAAMLPPDLSTLIDHLRAWLDFHIGGLI